MRLIMMGTGSFAVPTFRGLYDTHHTVVGLVTAPTRARGSRQPVPLSPMRDVAHEHGTPVLDPESVNSLDSQRALTRLRVDLMVVCDYGQILSATALATARLGGVNLHGSLLPKYRGAAPVHWAIYHGEKETGATVIHMTPQVDAGPCIAQGKVLIDPEETAVELEARLAEMGAWLIRRAIDTLEAGRLEALPQDPSLASKAPRLKKSDGAIDWSRPAEAIKNQVRAFQPWPKTFTYWHRRSGEPVRLIVGPVSVEDPPDSDARPGTVVETSGSRLVVMAGTEPPDRGGVVLREVQPAGKRAMGIEEFLRGYRVQPDDHLGPE